jgi:hypothetical protein
VSRWQPILTSRCVLGSVIVNTMQQCWQLESSARPSFETMCSRLGEFENSVVVHADVMNSNDAGGITTDGGV